MGRPKKTDTTENKEVKKSTKKKTEKVTKSDYNFHSYITENIIPYFETQIDIIIPLAEKFIEEHELSREEWKVLHEIVVNLCDKADQSKILVSFDKNVLAEYGKYHVSHSVHYITIAVNHMKYFLHQIEVSKKYSNAENDKELRYYQGAIYIAAQHLYFFITAKEKN